GDRVLVLDRGAIQQIAPPAQLYREPANAFVASFIGAPGMNLFTGRIEPATAGLRFVSPALAFDLPAPLADRLRGRATVTLGVRPEHLRRAAADDAPVRGEITAVER